ncbi:hypothetical protein GCM10007881_63590 [Mesorhizobium huakuii]|nr:hypothetical protein GCM10007881_63590 [Mesorhizobium huakuii]
MRDSLPAFLVAHPGIDIDLDERPSHEIAEAVASGAADLGIAATWAGLSHLEQKPFFIDRLVVIAARSWPGLAGLHSVSLADILGESLVGLSLGHALQEHITRQAARLGGHLHIRIRVPGSTMSAGWSRKAPASQSCRRVPPAVRPACCAACG